MTLATLLRTNASVAWLVLVTLTVISWALGTEHGLGGNHMAASLVIIVVAVFKVRIVGLYFMELRDAPTPLRAIFEGYSVLLAVLLSAMYMFG